MACACSARPVQRAGEHGEDPLEPEDVEDAQGSIHRHAAPGPRLHAGPCEFLRVQSMRKSSHMQRMLDGESHARTARSRCERAPRCEGCLH